MRKPAADAQKRPSLHNAPLQAEHLNKNRPGVRATTWVGSLPSRGIGRQVDASSNDRPIAL